ncbi:MAG: response regulator [Spirochaetales bacterium]|nr:response regulator [Spirochaetales bacterium]
MSYVYIYITERQRYMKFMLAGWALYILRFVANMLKLYHPELIYLDNIILICNAASAVFLYLAVSILLEVKINRPYVFLGLLVLAVIIPALPGRRFFDVRQMGVFLFSGAVFIYTGLAFLSRKYKRTALSKILGGIFILWGVHKWDYPFLYDTPMFAVPGYLLGVFCAFTSALGILIYHNRQDKTELLKVKERLTLLMKIPKNISAKDLYDRVLGIALKVTESAYGYLYFYDEDAREFTLNTWSDGVMADCSVSDPQTTYALEKTGYWGEVIRQRKPIIENAYSPDRALAKGLPEGHVPITRFCSVPMETDGRITAVIGVANKDYYYTDSDIDQLRMLMNDTLLLVENRHVGDELVKAKELAQESEKIKTDFLANISHELRTPLNGIIGMLGLLDSSELTEADRDVLKLARESADDLHDKIKDILMLSEITSYQAIDETVFCMGFIVRTLIDSVQRSKTYKNKDLVIEYRPGGQDVCVKTDRLYLSQVLLNLISNAVKFTDYGKVTVTVEHRDGLHIVIADEGCGISEENMKKIFDPFQQLENPYTKVHGGLGVGLAITSHLCKLLGFELRVESEIGKGSVFTVVVPESCIAVEPDNGSVGTGNFQEVSVLPVHSVLIVEDEAINRFYLKKILSEKGLSIQEATDGETAIERLLVGHFDVVLLDIGLPKVNGIEVLQFMRGSEGLKDIPVIAVTAHSNTEDKMRILSAGANDIIFKPYQQHEIINSLMRTIETAGAEISAE